MDGTGKQCKRVQRWTPESNIIAPHVTFTNSSHADQQAMPAAPQPTSAVAWHARQHDALLAGSIEQLLAFIRVTAYGMLRDERAATRGEERRRVRGKIEGQKLV
eukprot:SAG31_NODE_2731_length_5175_cov_1.794129_7_plen_104_part_00